MCLREGGKDFAKDQKQSIITMHAWAAYMSFECLEKWKWTYVACARMCTPFEDLILCVFPAGPLPAYSSYPSVGILGGRSKPVSLRLLLLQALCANAAQLRNAE